MSRKFISGVLAVALALSGQLAMAEVSAACASQPARSDKDTPEVGALIDQIKLACATQQLNTINTPSTAAIETTADKVKAISDALATWKAAAPAAPDAASVGTNLQHVGQYKGVQLLRDGTLEVARLLKTTPGFSGKYLLSTNPDLFQQRLVVRSTIEAIEQQTQTINDAITETKEVLNPTKALMVSGITAFASLVPAVMGAVTSLKARATYVASGTLDTPMADRVIVNAMLSSPIKDQLVWPGSAISTKSSLHPNVFGDKYKAFMDAVKELKAQQKKLAGVMIPIKGDIADAKEAIDAAANKKKLTPAEKKALVKAKTQLGTSTAQLGPYTARSDTNATLLADAEAAEKLLRTPPTGSTMTPYAMLWVDAENSLGNVDTQGTALVYPVQSGSHGMLVTRNFFLHDKLVIESSLSLAYFLFSATGAVLAADTVQLYSGFTRNQIDASGHFNSTTSIDYPSK